MSVPHVGGDPVSARIEPCSGVNRCRVRSNRGAADAGQFWIRPSELVLLYRFLSVFEAVVCASSIPLRISPRDAGKSNALGTTPMRLNQLPCGGTRTHDQDENDTRSMAALCQSLLRLRDASKTALIVVHHVRKSHRP